MERIIWVIGNNKADMIEVQRKINSKGNLRALCMLSYEKVVKEVENQQMNSHDNSRTPTLIIIDYDTLKTEESMALTLLRNHQRLQGVPLFFMVHELTPFVEEECYELGAMVVLHIPFTNADLTRVERTAWQTEVTRNYEKMLQKQASDLQSAREILKLNQQLETRNQILSQIFGRYFSDDVADVILDNPDAAVIGGEKKKVTVMMSDLRGFTSASENLDPVAVTDLLCTFFEKMCDPIQKYHGTVIEFLGDGILAVFGAPITTKDHTADAIAAAISMQNLMKEVNAYCLEKKYPHMELGIGLHAGEVFIGNIGSEKMMRYNVIGSTVNECSRIESTSVGGQIFISESSIRNCVYPIEISNRLSVSVKGFRKPLEICQITGIGEPYNCYQGIGEIAKMNPVSQNIMLDLYPVEKKMVENVAIKAVLLSFSEKEALIELQQSNRKIEVFSDMEVAARLGNQSVFSGVYAKVLESDERKLLIHFTRVNQDFDHFISSKGVVETVEENVLNGFEEIREKDCGWPCLVSYRKKEQDFCVISIKEDMVPYYEGILLHGENEGQTTNSRIELFKELNCQLLFLTWNSKDEVHVIVASNTTRIRALEFMDYLMGDFGLIDGDAKCATGVISTAILKVQAKGEDLEDTLEYFMKLIDGYYKDCCWIDCKEYSLTNQSDILQMNRYKKQRVMWAVVKSTEVANEGEEIWFKSLENESGFFVTASENIYIMVGCRGEIYYIQKSKFENSYDESDEPLDVFEQMLDSIPEIVRKSDNSFVSLDEVAHLCYPKQGPGIYAKQIDKRTKVFPVNMDEYFLGRAGDYLAVRCDDLSDMYIIQGDIFVETYEQVE